MGFTKEEYERLQKELNISLNPYEGRENAEKIFNAIKLLSNREVEYIDEIVDWLGYGKYFHINEDNPMFIDEFDDFYFIIEEGENSLADADINTTDSDYYAVVTNGGKWVWCDSYEKLDDPMEKMYDDLNKNKASELALEK